MTNHHCCRFGIFSFAFAAAVTWAFGTFILGLLAMYYQLGVPIVSQMAILYKGFGPSLGGALWGTLWAFIDGFIAGLIFAVIYNLVISCCGICRREDRLK